MDLDKLLDKFRHASKDEARALRRLRLAQTLFDKYRDRRARHEAEYFAVLDTVNRIARKLTDSH